jgi:hypothetical protein
MRRLSMGALIAICALLLLSVDRAAAEPIVALNAEWANLNPPTEEANWEVIEQSGATVLRWQFDWFTEVEEGGWGPSYDRYVEKAARHGITLMGLLYARKDNSPQFYTANEAGPWLEEFVEPAIKRYGESGTFWAEHPSVPYRPITAWEVWNEPNLPMNNPSKVVNPGAYRELLKAASNVIHNAANSRQWPNNAKVIFGGIYQGSSAEASVNYFNAVAEGFGLTPYFEGVGIHPYTFGGEKATEASRLAGFKEKVDAIRKAVSVLCAECAANESLWVTEIGWPVSGVVKPVTEAEQANLLTSSFNWMRGESGRLNLQLMAWYDYADAAGSAWPEKSGLRRSDGTYRQSWWTFTNQTGHPLPGDGGLQMHLDSSGQVFATNELAGYWTLETPPGETQISAGAGGLQMLIDGGGQIWAKNIVGSGGWTKETPSGQVAISAGAGGLQMLIESAGQIWATNSIGGVWTNETPPEGNLGGIRRPADAARKRDPDLGDDLDWWYLGAAHAPGSESNLGRSGPRDAARQFRSGLGRFGDRRHLGAGDATRERCDRCGRRRPADGARRIRARLGANRDR